MTLDSLVRIVSGVALAQTIVPPVLFFLGRMTLPDLQMQMLIATIMWFAATPFWMKS